MTDDRRTGRRRPSARTPAPSTSLARSRCWSGSQGPRAQAAGPRGAHHARARRRRQGHAHADRGGVPRRLPQPAARAAGGRGVADASAGRLAFTTDSFVVSPLFFPGGDIGDLAVNGTVNDLAMCGARPLYLSAGFILEEGFPVADLQRIVASMARGGRGGRGADRHRRHQGRRAGQGRRLLHHTAGVGLLDRPVDAVAPPRRGRATRCSSPGRSATTASRHARPRRAGHRGRHRLRHRAAARADRRRCSTPCPTASGCCATPPAAAWRRSCNEVAVASQVAVVLDEGAVPVRPEVNGASRAARDRPAVRGVRGTAGRRRRRRTGPTTRWPRCASHPLGAGAARDRHGAATTRPAWCCCGRRSAAPGSSTCSSATRCRGSADGIADVHELAITESIVAAVVERMADTPVRRVRLAIGRLSGVVPDAVRFCFDLVTAGTTAGRRGAGDRRAPRAGGVPGCGGGVRLGRGARAVPVRQRGRRAAARAGAADPIGGGGGLMCGTCGCAGGGRSSSGRPAGTAMSTGTAHEPGDGCPSGRHGRPLEIDVLAKNDGLAAVNREWLARRRDRRAEPDELAGRGQDDAAGADRPRPGASCRCPCIEGDQETVLDAERIRRGGRPGRADQHRRRLPPRRRHGGAGAAGARSRGRVGGVRSRTSATWCARRCSTSASGPAW